MSQWQVVLAYLALLTVITFAHFAWDKRAAKRGERRIPERRLLGLCALGGIFGGWLAVRWIRHKSRKTSFLVPMLVISLAWVGVLVVLFPGL